MALVSPWQCVCNPKSHTHCQDLKAKHKSYLTKSMPLPPLKKTKRNTKKPV